MEEQRALLDSLMGIHRDAGAEERKDQAGESFKDVKVCKKFLVNFCPNEFFRNTKRELGPCQYLHNDHVIQEFEAHPDFEMLKQKYEVSLRIFLEDIVRDADRWIEREKKNAKRPAPNVEDIMSMEERDQVEKLQQISIDLIRQSEKDAESGHLAFSEARTAQAVQAKTAIEQIKERRMASYLKREELGVVCEICGIRQEIGSELTPHEYGKVHQGYILVRAKILELLEKEKAHKEKHRPDKKSRSRSKNAEKGQGGSSTTGPVVGGDKGKDGEKKKRSTSPKKNASRSRSKKNDESKRSRSRNNNGRSRSRNNNRSRGRERSRSRNNRRSRSRNNRSRQRSRSRGNDRHQRERSYRNDRRRDNSRRRSPPRRQRSRSRRFRRR